VLPLIVIGADERTREAVTSALNLVGLPSPFKCLHMDYEDIAQASCSLSDALRCERDSPGTFTRYVEFDDERPGWKASVAYGPKALGPATVAQSSRLAHTGWTLVLAWGAPDLSAPRRVTEGVAEGADQSSIAWQAAPMLGANFLVDLSAEDPRGKLRYPGLVTVLTQMRERVEP